MNELFEKGKEYVNFREEVKKRFDSLQDRIVNSLENWFNEHEEELAEHYDDAVNWFGISGDMNNCGQFRDWYYDKETNTFTLNLVIGYGEDSWHSNISVFPDGHWERRLENFKTAKRG